MLASAAMCVGLGGRLLHWPQRPCVCCYFLHWPQQLCVLASVSVCWLALVVMCDIGLIDQSIGSLDA